jgi:hypothetical protein
METIMAAVPARVQLKCYKCNQPIKFDNKVKSKSGRLVPLNTDGIKHQCPNSTYKPVKKEIKCNRCAQPIQFDKNIKSKNDKFIPLNLDGSHHDCPNSEFNQKNQQQS